MNLEKRDWKEFVIQDLFYVNIGKNIDGNKISKYSGKTAYVTRKESNNGIDGFINYDTKFINNSEGNSVITIGNETAKPFLQDYPFFTGTKVNVLTPKNKIPKHALFFISVSLNKHKSKYSYSFTINSTRLKRQKILLPVTSEGNPDYPFMESYVQKKEKEKTKIYEYYIQKRVESLKVFENVKPLDDKKWDEFELHKIFTIKSGRRLTKANMKSGKKPFIGATDSNNGITEFVSNSNKSEDSNVLGVNYNGSVVENFYHPYKALFTDDVKRLSFKNVKSSKHLFLFVKVQILKQKIKYKYGYKFNSRRMKKQKIMLPVNEKREPDYDYMENYMKRIEYLTLKKYLDQKSIEIR